MGGNLGALVILHEKYDKRDYYFVARRLNDRYQYLTGAIGDRKEAEKTKKEIEGILNARQNHSKVRKGT